MQKSNNEWLRALMQPDYVRLGQWFSK